MELFNKVRDGEQGRLICFPYLGGYVNSFCDLIQAFEQKYEIWVANPPGHLGSNVDLVSDIDILTDLYYQEIRQIISPDCCMLGHSMGGIVAFVLINKIAYRNNLPLPGKLVLSASSVPQVFGKRHWSQLSDAAFVDCIRDYGGLPESLLANQDLMDIMLPIFRADYRVLESSAKIKLQRMNVETLILWGEDDKVDAIDNAYMWQDLLSEKLNVVLLKNAAHMFIHNQAHKVAAHIEHFMSS